ncbi:MAG TPA: DUF1801 domain-containing protein [Thermoanaerobaculia bacterium]
MADANNKTKATKASVAKFLGALEAERRKDCETLVKMLRRVTKAQPKMWGPSIIGFGDHHYEYESGREADWFVAGFSPRKSGLVCYFMSAGGGLDPGLMERLGKHKTGKGCLYIKRLSDVDLAVLEKVALRAAGSLRASSRR